MSSDNGSLRFRAITVDYGLTVRILGVVPSVEDPSTFAKIAAPCALELVPYNRQTIDRDTLSLGMRSAQSLADALWEAGVRPTATKGKDDAPEVVRAMGKHLEDMRTLVFAKLEVPRP